MNIVYKAASISCIVLGSLGLANTSQAATYQRFNHDKPFEALALAAPYLPQNPTIIDAGAYDGTDTIIMAQYWPQATLHSFEPLPPIYQRLVLKAKPFNNVFTYEMALSDKVGIAQFHVSEVPWEPQGLWQSSSLLAPKEHLTYAPWVQFNRTIQVPTTTIDIWAANHLVDHIDFLWLDLQGYELPVLKASPTILRTVKAILTEIEFVEAYAGQPLYQEIKQWLEEQGFEMIAINIDLQNPRHDWFGDALFVRKSSEQVGLNKGR